MQQWELYRAGLKAQVAGYAKVKGYAPPRAGKAAKPDRAGEPRARDGSGVRRRRSRGSSSRSTRSRRGPRTSKEHPDALKALGLTPQLANSILNYVNGTRTAATIRNYVAAETGQDVPLESVLGCLDLLRQIKWLQ